MTVVRIATLCIGMLAFSAMAQTTPWVARYEGPDAITLVSRPNMAATNARSAVTQTRDTAAGELDALVAPIVAKALEGCSMQGITRVVIAAHPMPDRIGDTMSRLHGFGIYVNLPLADRVSNGTWVIAPFFALGVKLAGESGPGESIELFETDRAIIKESLPMTQDRFFDARTEDLVKAIAIFTQARLPETLRKALGKRCP